MNDHPSNIQNAITRLMDGFRDIFHLPAIAADPDIENRRDAYVHAATVLRECLACRQPVARDAIHRLCSEQNSTLLAEGEPCDEILLAQARDLLLTVRVKYTLEGTRRADRVTTIAFLNGDRPVMRHVTETLGWDFLPRLVRDDRLCHGTDQLAFQIYP